VSNEDLLRLNLEGMESRLGMLVIGIIEAPNYQLDGLKLYLAALKFAGITIQSRCFYSLLEIFVLVISILQSQKNYKGATKHLLPSEAGSEPPGNGMISLSSLYDECGVDILMNPGSML
jgi:hypothetical protein